MRGYCQVCYNYFIQQSKNIYPVPPYGEIWYADNGDCICPLCGKAFRKLGRHFNQSHNMSSDEAHKFFGWDRNAKATNVSYRKLMQQKLQKKCVVINLLKKGQATRYAPGASGRTKNKVSAMTLHRLKQQFKKENA